ncbi:cTPxI [Vermiconidia calcicola]|uniref:CTPxI n=1 Tax=Vermiconidia calcicola TaxID=1690605 RepID=A0ACC3NU79_9PEZI|nr:cTPxI [Vermiconidia calcicola]
MTLGQVQVGRPAPQFACTAVVDGRLKEVSLSGYTEANHWLILVFFPKAWSFICPTEIKAFSARLEEFLYSRSCAVVFASTDSEHCLKAWNATSDLEGGLGGVHVPLISDCGHKLSRDYGVLIEETGVAQRALFVIDPKGMVRSITVNDADVGRSVDECLRVIDALAFKDEFGEGCPVDWKKGDKGIDIASKTRVEGTVELKKSWSEWARPKLNRAWSNTSGRSISSNIAATLSNSRLRADSNSSGQQTPAFSPTSNGQTSPVFSPTSNMSMEALMQQRMENM